MSRNLILSLLLATSVCAQINDCSTVLGHVYDKTTRQESYLGSDSFESFFCDKTYLSYGQARDAGGALEIPIDDLPVSFNGHSKESDWGSYQHEVCNAVRTQSHVEFALNEAISKINSKVIAAWQACMTSNRPGLYFYAEVDDNSRTVTFSVKYIGLGDNDTMAPLQSPPLSFSPSNSIKNCRNQFPREIGKNLRIQACQRAGDRGVTAVLSTLHDGDLKALVPPIRATITPELPKDYVTDHPCIEAYRFQQYRVSRGERVSVRAGISTACGIGGWTIDGGLTRSGPDGADYQGKPYTSPLSLAPGLKFGTLIGAFSNKDITSTNTQEVWDIVRSAGPIAVGSAFDQVATIDGFFYLIINDIANASADNAQGVNIDVRINGVLIGPSHQ